MISGVEPDPALVFQQLPAKGQQGHPSCAAPPAPTLQQSAPSSSAASRPADSEPCSISTRFRSEAPAAPSTSQTSPAEGASRAAGPAAAGAPTPDRCGRAGWCAPHPHSQSGATSHHSMPPADPGTASNHVADTSLKLQEQHMRQHSSMQLPGPAQHTAAVQAGAAQQQRGSQGAHTGPVRAKQPTPAVAGTDSEDDSWTPGQQQPQNSGMDEQAEAEPAPSADDNSSSDDDMMAAAAAYDDFDDADVDDAAWDPDPPVPSYCTNCTARLFVSARCSDCGHSNEQDSELLSSSAASAEAEAVPAGDCPLIIWDDDMLLHEEGKREPHPERPDRLRAVMAQLNSNGLTGLCQRVPARLATKQELLRVHTPDHLHRLQLFCSGQVPPSAIPSDTYINQHTLQCAALAAGSAAEVAVRVYQGEASCGAAIIRPPGHHAESNTAMGFCFFNNAAVAARAAQEAGAQRVLILDWDVHHGNGTQHIFEADDSVLYMSVHRYDRGQFYPGTGAATEVGRGEGEGFTVNVPWDTDGVTDADYMAAMQQVLLPIAREFGPDLVLISAGFDAAAGDPIGGCNLTPECFGAMTAALMPIAPTVLLLEGGYNLRSTALSTEACLRVLLGEPAPELPSGSPSPYAWFSIQAARKAHSRFWSCLQGSAGLPPVHVRMPVGWGATAAAAAGVGGQDEQQQEGSDLELQYADEYEEEEYESEGEGQEEEGEEEQEGLDSADGEGDGTGAADGVSSDPAAAAVGWPGHQQHHPEQQQRPHLAEAAAGVRPGSKRGSEGVRGGDDAGGEDEGVDAGRRVRFAAAAAAGLPPYLRRAAAGHSGSSTGVQMLLRNGSGASSSSSAGSGGGARRVLVSRKQQMLRAIHKRAMQLFLRKQRQLAAAKQQRR